MRGTPLLGAALFTALLLAGCGDTEADDAASDEPTEEPAEDTTGATAGDTADEAAGEPVVVVAEDITFPEDSYEAAAGEVAFEYHNEGAIPHTLVIEDVDGFKLEVASNGDVDEGSVEIEAGSYTLYCDVPGHRDAGMEATLEVS